MEEIAITWQGEGLRFIGSRGKHETVIDGDSEIGPGPVTLLLESVAACMAIDVLDILQKGRQHLTGLTVRTLAKRREEPPRYVWWLRLEFEIAGDVERVKAERAVRLSFDRYCSVFHSLRQDLEVESEITLLG